MIPLALLMFGWFDHPAETPDQAVIREAEEAVEAERIADMLGLDSADQLPEYWR